MKKQPVEIYKGKPGAGKGRWRWRVRGLNGRILANSGEGYRNVADCLTGLELTHASIDLRLSALPDVAVPEEAKAGNQRQKADKPASNRRSTK